MALPADRLYVVARAALDAVADFYIAEDVDLPERQYVSDGPAAAWDCEQAVVYVERTFQGTSDQEEARAIDCLDVRSCSMQIEVVRCSPVPDDETGNVVLPSPAEIEASAQLVLADAVLVPNALRAAWKAGDLGGCHGMTVGNWQGLGPLGGLVGGRLELRVQLTL